MMLKMSAVLHCMCLFAIFLDFLDKFLKLASFMPVRLLFCSYFVTAILQRVGDYSIIP